MFTEERTISKGLWPPRSPDLSSCGFYLSGTLKQNVYANNPHNLDQLKENIINAIRKITREELQAVSANVVKRVQKCIDVNGEHFQHKTIFYNTIGNLNNAIGNLNNERVFLFSITFSVLLLSGRPYISKDKN